MNIFFSAIVLALAFFTQISFADDGLMEVSIFTGVPGLARIGQSARDVEQNASHPFQRQPVDKTTELGKMGFSEVFIFKDIGSKVYFRRDGVGLITMQEPFKGRIKGKNIKLFSFAVPPVANWETLLIKELGEPEGRSSGGRLGSEGLFYSWGDLSYNRMGPNELALYRNADLAKYRLKNFGREIELFPK